MLSVQSFQFHTGLRQLFEPTMNVALVRVQGMQVNIPPHGERASLTLHRKSQGPSKRSIVLGQIDVQDVTLTIETNKPGEKAACVPHPRCDVA